MTTTANTAPQFVLDQIAATEDFNTRCANPVEAGTVNPNTGTWKKMTSGWAVAVEDVQIGQTVTVRNRAGKEKIVTIGSLALSGNTILGIPAASRATSTRRQARAASRRFGSAYGAAIRNEY